MMIFVMKLLSKLIEYYDQQERSFFYNIEETYPFLYKITKDNLATIYLLFKLDIIHILVCGSYPYSKSS